ncbi:MAG: AzlD domain-containing protein [Christensenellales bacterium]|nr:AzlD domain-containing protein [Christensenellales bacterium]
MEWGRFFSYLAVMAGVTYLVRMLPLAVLRRKIKSRFLLSFLYYAPYAVLGALTFPDILYATGTLPSALLGLAAALAAAWLGRPLLVVALAASAAAVLARLAGI